MKATSYSTYPRTAVWKSFAMRFPKKTMSDFAVFQNAVQDEWDKKPPINGFDAFLVMGVQVVAEAIWRFSEMDHYFLAPGVTAFVTGAVKDFSSEYLKRLPECKSWPYLGGPEMCSGGFAIHFPAKERQKSLIVIPKARFYTSKAKTMTEGFEFVVTDGHKMVLANPCNIDKGDDEEYTFIAKVVYGLSLYMDAFPETVVPAGSDTVHNIKHYHGPQKTVARNSVVEEEERRGVSPHWRRGHFRLLTSERFVRKQGQTVYVKGTFVNGKAYDVLDDSPETHEGEPK